MATKTDVGNLTGLLTNYLRAPKSVEIGDDKVVRTVFEPPLQPEEQARRDGIISSFRTEAGDLLTHEPDRTTP